MTMIDHNSTPDEVKAVLDDSMRALFSGVQEQHGPAAVYILELICFAMIDHASGERRGITMQTWHRWARMILDGEYLTVWNRLYSNAHWTPEVTA